MNEEKLNQGIIKTAEFLQAHGFRTTDSGDGKTHDFGCDLPMPYVHMVISPDKLIEESHRLLHLLESVGVKFGKEFLPTIEASYSPIDQIAILSVYNVKLPMLEV